jgi:hypothetical protein
MEPLNLAMIMQGGVLWPEIFKVQWWLRLQVDLNMSLMLFMLKCARDRESYSPCGIPGNHPYCFGDKF